MHGVEGRVETQAKIEGQAEATDSGSMTADACLQFEMGLGRHANLPMSIKGIGTKQQALLNPQRRRLNA